MVFKSVNGIIGGLTGRFFQEYQEQFVPLLKCWPQVVGTVGAAHSRPLQVERSVLLVAVANASWCHELTLKRSEILLQLNETLNWELVDMRFSTAAWYRKRESFATAEEQRNLWAAHPCRLPPVPVPKSPSRATDAKAAFESWSESVRSRFANLPICDKCGCPAPQGELERWNVCAICATKDWSRYNNE